nr:uncharacterized protein LOC113819850 [Penaeus vannamei]
MGKYSDIVRILKPEITPVENQAKCLSETGAEGKAGEALGSSEATEGFCSPLQHRLLHQRRHHDLHHHGRQHVEKEVRIPRHTPGPYTIEYDRSFMETHLTNEQRLL